MSRFEWDDTKNAAILKKHGISFEKAAQIFEGPVFSRHGGRSDEVREISFGHLGDVIVVCVVHTDRAGKIRIMSARKATRRERTLFHAYLEMAIG